MDTASAGVNPAPGRHTPFFSPPVEHTDVFEAGQTSPDVLFLGCYLKATPETAEENIPQDKHG